MEQATFPVAQDHWTDSRRYAATAKYYRQYAGIQRRNRSQHVRSCLSRSTGGAAQNIAAAYDRCQAIASRKPLSLFCKTAPGPG